VWLLPSPGDLATLAGSEEIRRSGDAPTTDHVDDPAVDTIGARYLAARLRAGVAVGTTIVLEQGSTESGLEAGDRGVVEEITLDGVVVEWERGFSLRIDPEHMPYRALAAA
jgi:hypothetical protein